MPKLIYDAIRPTGSQKPPFHFALYCLWQVCSIINLASGWLAVLERFSSHCISDFFTFAKTMQNLNIDPNIFMCSFDASSLFTNVPHDKSIKIDSETLYDDSDLQPLIPKNVFLELMKSTTSSVEFSFKNTVQANRRSSYGIITWSGFG